MLRITKKLRNMQINSIIKMRRWKPLGVCNTSNDDLLVILESDAANETKVVRYSNYIDKQTIQYYGGQPLYSTSGEKYITENRNLDVCVADNAARAVVVVSEGGIFRFRYNGFCLTSRSFDPVSITTDRLSKILISDRMFGIHIVDQEGHFLCCINSFELSSPWGVCTDSKDNLFVAQTNTNKVKKIQYSE